jgi:hypothetical protein
MAEITDVLNRVIERTEQGQLNWKPTASEQTFVSVIGDRSVMISELKPTSRSPLPPFPPSVEFKILDKGGREIAVLDDEMVEGKERRQDLLRLYRSARSNALQVESQLEALLKDVEIKS